MNLLHQFLRYIRDEKLFSPDAHVLVAVSGGTDSVVLSELCKQAGIHFTIAHCNFQLRGQESERDEQFVRALGDTYKVEVLIKKFETNKYAAENKLSIQVAARELRYNWFQEVLENQEATMVERLRFVLTAHHANDNIETMLMNFFKGTGIAGLRAILPKQGKIIRPLLFARKSSILEFATENKLKFVEDSSNSSDKYTRNYFRHQLLPSIEKVFPAVEDNLVRNLSRFKEVEQLYSQAIEKHKKNLLEAQGSEIYIPVLKLKKSVPLETITYEIIKEYGFTAHQAGEVIELLDSETGKYVKSETFRIIKSRNWLIISPNRSEESQTIIINREDNRFVFEKGLLELKVIPVGNSQLSSSPGVAQIDAAEISFPLLLRKRKPGDYFYPLGMPKKKKLNRFLSDQKLSVTERESTWVLEMNKKIIWVVGRRIDERFKVTPKTQKILQVSYSPSGS